MYHLATRTMPLGMPGTVTGIETMPTMPGSGTETIGGVPAGVTSGYTGVGPQSSITGDVGMPPQVPVGGADAMLVDPPHTINIETLPAQPPPVDNGSNVMPRPNTVEGGATYSGTTPEIPISNYVTMSVSAPGTGYGNAAMCTISAGPVLPLQSASGIDIADIPTTGPDTGAYSPVTSMPIQLAGTVGNIGITVAAPPARAVAGVDTMPPPDSSPDCKVVTTGPSNTMAPDSSSGHQDKVPIRVNNNGNIFSSSFTAAPGTPESDMATEAVTPPYEIDLNNSVAAGETQQVGDDQGGDEGMQAPLGGDTQLVDDQEGFDDIVELQNGMLTVPSMPLRNDLADTSHVMDVDGDTPGAVMVAEATVVSNRETHTFVTVQGEETVFSSELLESQTPPAVVTVEQTSTPINEGVGKAKNDIQGNPTNNPKRTRREDIEAIKGKQVCKQFGRKKFKGEVVDYDEENKWFKVVYEDGDQEDLELEEVIAILIIEEASPAAQKKSLHSEADHKDREGRSAKRHRREIAVPARKGKTRLRTPKKTGKQSAKRGAGQAKRGRKRKPLQKDAASKSSEARRSELSPAAAVAAEKSPAARGRPQKNVGREPKSRISGKKETDAAKTVAEQKSPSRKTPGRKAVWTKRGGAKRRSLSDLSSKSTAAHVKEKEEPHRKRLKSDGFGEERALVGKSVEKSFDGDVYNGVVVRFDRRTGWFKVKYEDGDEEELELEELTAILVE